MKVKEGSIVKFPAYSKELEKKYTRSRVSWNTDMGYMCGTLGTVLSAPEWSQYIRVKPMFPFHTYNAFLWDVKDLTPVKVNNEH